MSKKISAVVVEIFRNSSIIFFIKVLAALFSFLFSVFLGRLLGSEGTGLYFLTQTIILIFAVLSRIGLDNAVVRYVAHLRINNDWGNIIKVRKNAILFGVFGSFLAIFFIIFISPWLANVVFSKPEMQYLLIWMSLSILPITIFSLNAYVLQGLNKVAEAISIISFWVPLLSLIGVILLVPTFNIYGAIWSYIAAVYINLIISYCLWKKSKIGKEFCLSRFSHHKLLKSSFPLFGATILNLIVTWSPTIVLGVVSASEQIGIFGVANRTASLASFFLVAINSVVAPKFATLYSQNKIKELQVVASSSATIVTVVATPFVLVCLIFSSSIMKIFGEDFVSGDFVFLILLIGQFVNILTGSVGMLLIMSGNESIYRNVMGLSTMLCLALSIFLIPLFEATGAALATSITMIAQNIILAVIVWMRIKILTLPFMNLFK